jgi:tRNA-specific 2-thiouridylase
VIIVGLSGGVDSAVAALLLREQGHEVQGLFMANWKKTTPIARSLRTTRTRAQSAANSAFLCTASISLRNTGNACSHYFVAEYRAGRTPNPDVLCNREIKFGVCLEHVRRLGGEHLATGRYAEGLAVRTASSCTKPATPARTSPTSCIRCCPRNSRRHCFRWGSC